MTQPIGILPKPLLKSQTKSSIKSVPSISSKKTIKQPLDSVDEEFPFLKDDQRLERKNFKAQNMLFSMIQDPRKTFFAYKKFLFMEKTLFILTFIGFFISLIKTQVQELYGPESIDIICHCNSVSTLALIFCLFLRYLGLFGLRLHQKKVYIHKFCQNESMLIAFLMKSRNELYSLLFEVLIVIPHANALLVHKTVTIFQSYDEVYITHEINDIMAILSLLRVYIVVRSLINITLYSTPRSSRLCQQNGVEHNILYSIKCILNQEPLKAIFVIFAISLTFLGVGLKLSEGVLTKNNPTFPNTGFSEYNNCFWCVFITMATVGYGDYIPKTILGKIISFSTALTGIVLSSLLIVSLSAYLQMQASQSKSHITMMRIEEQQKLKQEATTALCSTIELMKKMSRKELNDGQELKCVFNELKRKIDLVKLRTKKIKCLVDNDNILEEMNRLFEILKDNLRDIYQNQMLIKNIIQKIKIPNRINRSVKLSFAKEMRRAIQIL